MGFKEHWVYVSKESLNSTLETTIALLSIVN